MRALIVAAALLASTAANAQASFVIERIDVAGVERVSLPVIVYESRLTAGRAYTEQQLSEANDRLRRLPFVLDATFALQKGSERDRYVLVITVEETKPLFYVLDMVMLARDRTELLLSESNGGVIGARFFAGPRSAFHFGAYAQDSPRPFTRGYAIFQAGYTRYDVLGTNALVTVALNQTFAPMSSTRFLPEALVALPVSGNQTVTLRYSTLATSIDAEQLIEARWTYNTTNDPFFPTRGSVIAIGPVASNLDGETRAFTGETITSHHQARGLELDLKRHWEIDERHSVGAEFLGGRANIDRTRAGLRTEFTQTYGEVAVKLGRALRTAPASPSRLELLLRDRRRRTRHSPTASSSSVSAGRDEMRGARCDSERGTRGEASVDGDGNHRRRALRCTANAAIGVDFRRRGSSRSSGTHPRSNGSA